MHGLVLASADRICTHIYIGTPDLCALVKTVSSTNVFPQSQGNFAEKNKIKKITTSSHHGYTAYRWRCMHCD